MTGFQFVVLIVWDIIKVYLASNDIEVVSRV